MHLLYIDGSGSVQNPQEKYFVLAGISVFERSVYHLIQALDAFVDSLRVPDPYLAELHGVEIFHGKKQPWKGIHKRDRARIINGALNTLETARKSARAFGVIVDKRAIDPRDPVEYAFEEICNRFNLYLQRLYHRGGKGEEFKQRGLVIMDNSKYEEALQTLAREFRVRGTRWGSLRNLAEVPLFIDSRASRLVQLADLVAYAVWRKYEHQDGRFCDPIMHRFDSEGGILHGLVHFHARSEQCLCPACMSRTMGAPQRKPAPKLIVGAS